MFSDPSQRKDRVFLVLRASVGTARMKLLLQTFEEEKFLQEID